MWPSFSLRLTEATRFLAKNVLVLGKVHKVIDVNKAPRTSVSKIGKGGYLVSCTTECIQLKCVFRI